MSDIIRLTDDEIRALMVILDANRMAVARLAMAQEQEAEMIALLRRKYGVDDKWKFRDLLTGFERGSE